MVMCAFAVCRSVASVPLPWSNVLSRFSTRIKNMSKTDAFWQLCLSADLTDEVRLCTSGHAHSLAKSLPHSELRYLSIGLNCVNFFFFAFNSQCSETVIQKSWTITYDTSFNREKNACPEHFRNDSQSCLTVFLCHRKTVQLCSVAAKGMIGCRKSSFRKSG